MGVTPASPQPGPQAATETLSGLPVAVLEAVLRGSCAAQGVSLLVRDARVIRDVAALLGGVLRR
jgi:hypothetical protein